LTLSGCCKEISGVTVRDRLVYRIEGVSDTKAYIVNSDNVELLCPEMTVKGVKRNTSAANDDVLFTDTFAPSTSEVVSLSQRWEEDSYVFYSYPSDYGINPSFTDNAAVFNCTVAKDAQSTPDAIIARTVQTRGNDVNFSYKHIYTAVNVNYKTVKIGHTISRIAITNTPTTGRCKMADDGKIYWDQLDNYSTLEDSNVRYATYNNQDVTEDGSKFMTIPGAQINLEIVIDGITIKKSCEAKKAGDIVNFYIEDDFEIKKEDGSAAEGTVERNENGTYKMTLETYVTGEYKTVIVPKPMDFILVLDFSGSMTNGYSDSKHPSYTPVKVTQYSYNDWKSNKTGYKATLNGTSYTINCLDLKNSGTDNIHWAYIVVGSDWYYVGLDGGLYKSSNHSPSMSNMPVSTDGVRIFPSVGGNPKLFATLGTGTSTKINNRITGLRGAVSDFIDLIYSQAQKDGVHHRVSIVGFQNPKFPRYTTKNSDRKLYIDSTSEHYLRQSFAESGDGTSQTTCVSFPFRDIQEANTVQAAKAAMELINYNGSTAIDYGMYIASLMAKQKRADAGTTVIVFTDGKPTHATGSISSDCVIPGYYAAGTTLTDDQVANGAISFSKTIKDSGCTVYSIGVFNSSDKPQSGFMDALSSNYPKATSMSSKGEGSTELGYYKDASSGNLSEVFELIAKSSAQASVDIHQDAYVSAIISDAFMLPEDYIEGSGNMTFYECAQTGYDTAKKKIIWSDTKTDITSQITCTMSPETQTISIKGFDYGKNFCICDAAGPFTGKKLIMVFDALVANPEREGTGANQAVEYTTGLYDDNGKPVTMFDPIYVNL